MVRSTTKSEEGVLKLIHPGKRIETYKEPIPASKILEKYPRFCITRPDVFKFPWIVVKPDSVLVPGKVFLLVPKGTVYRLLIEARKNQHQVGAEPSQDVSSSSLPPSLHQQQSSETSTNNPTPLKSKAGMTPKHLNNHPTRPIPTYQSREKPPEQDPYHRSRKYSQMESLPQMVSNNKSMRYSNIHDCYRCSSGISVEISNIKVVGNGSGKEGTRLKSCMRKPGGRRRLVNGRVTFSIPGQDIVEPVPKQRTVIDSLSKLASLLIVDACK